MKNNAYIYKYRCSGLRFKRPVRKLELLRKYGLVLFFKLGALLVKFVVNKNKCIRYFIQIKYVFIFAAYLCVGLVGRLCILSGVFGISGEVATNGSF